MLKGKNIVIGVCGGVAAYKVVSLASYLKKKGANVDVILTKNATEFVNELSFRSVTNNPVYKDMFDEATRLDVPHIKLAKKADIIVVAPATANILGKVANGIADDMLSTTIMATPAKVLFVPAMNAGMFMNPIVQNNVSKLMDYGYFFKDPDHGEMACGDVGVSRLPDTEPIVESIIEVLDKSNVTEEV